MEKSKIFAVFQRLARQFPNPTTDLIHHSPFELLVAVILSARATDKSVNKVTKQLFTFAGTPEKMFALGERALRKNIKSIGLSNAKAKNIIQTCQILVEKYSGNVPDKREDLESLPGVGRKTANVLLNVAFHQPTIPVDTHTFRVANRTQLATGKTPKEVEQILLAVVPKKFLSTAHYLLLLHGRKTCQARKPLCPACVIKDLCLYENKTAQSQETPHRGVSTTPPIIRNKL